MSRFADALDDIYSFIRDYLEKHDNMAPSVREIADACHLHISTTSRYLAQLERQGLIRRDSAKARSIRLVKKIDLEQKF
jgi:DNA-binding IclR family transcriptional regulator